MRRSRGDSGFALLLVLLFAAVIAIALYTELPRVAFETQRNREELLMYRGLEYQRAIGLYIKKMQRPPAKIEDLENTNNMRFLRRRYIDPMTGTDEWRMIHTANGVLTDSLIKQNNQGVPGFGGNQSGGNQNAGLTPASGMNVDPGFTSGTSTDPNQPQEVNAAVQKRASDRPTAVRS